MHPIVSISVVTWNSLPYIERCLDHIYGQKGISIEVIISDNNSSDGTLNFLRNQTGIILIEHKGNTGFSFAHNQAIKKSSGEFILIQNPDVFLSPTYVSELLIAFQSNNKIGQAIGKLFRVNSLDEIGKSNIIDSTGLYFTRNQRHFDRGMGETDQGQFNRQEYIFGGCGAAALYRRSALIDSAVLDEYYDEDFFAYREDADLSWRMQLLGWKAVYSPRAVAYHMRGMRSNDDRKSVSSEINMHSVKNRFLMRIKNLTLSLFINNAIALIWRDMQVIGYILLIEHSSLAAIIQLVKLFPKTVHKRNIIMRKKRVNDVYMAQWFVDESVSFPME